MQIEIENGQFEIWKKNWKFGWERLNNLKKKLEIWGKIETWKNCKFGKMWKSGKIWKFGEKMDI